MTGLGQGEGSRDFVALVLSAGRPDQRAPLIFASRIQALDRRIQGARGRYFCKLLVQVIK